MRRFEFSEEKNILLKKTRGVSFEDVLEAIEKKEALDDIEHPKRKYAHQGMYVIKIREYAYAAPYVKDTRGYIFFKTIYPSRKLTKQYLKKYEKQKAKGKI